MATLPDLAAVSRNLEEFKLPIPGSKDRITLKLHRLQPVPKNAPAVLLTHGGNTESSIYLYPRDRRPHGGLAGFLHEQKRDVWLLDWRGSKRVIDTLDRKHALGDSCETEREIFSMDRVAEEDFPLALAHIRSAIGAVPLSIVAYCVSSGALSMAVARGCIEPFDVRHFVLLSLGLFYEVPWNGWIKAEDFILERILHNQPDCRTINPTEPQSWPEDMSGAYHSWPASWLPPPVADDDDMLRRLSFMIGQAWSTERLHPTLRGNVKGFFGGFHLGLYLHAGQMVRRGYAARMNAPEAREPKTYLGAIAGSDVQPRFFDDKKQFTLICPQNNGVWHRNSMDLMFDWLRSHTHAQCSKVTIPGYNLHELLWGETASTDVYPQILSGLP